MMLMNYEIGLNFHQILAAIPVLLIRFMIGMGVGWIAPMLHLLKNASASPFTSEQCAWIAAGHYLSRGLSPFLIFLVLDEFGRNATLIFSALIVFFMWIPVYFSRSALVHYVVRLAFGVSVGFCGAAASIYIGENCSPKMRGVFSGLGNSFFYLGELVAFLLAAYLSYEWFAISGGLLGFVVVLSTCLLKEPAQYLIMKGNLEKAEKNYDYLHNLKKSRTRVEFEEIKQYIHEVKMKKNIIYSLVELRSPEVLKSLRIVVIVNFLALAGGFTAVNSFVTMALAGSDGLSTAHMTILIGLAQLLSVSLLSPFMDTFNRRTLLLLFSALVAITHAFIAALYYAASIYKIPHFYWLLFALLTIFMCLDGTISPLTTAISGELLPQNVKAMGSSLAVVSGSLGGFLTAKTFLSISDSFGAHVNFILFMFVNLILFVYVYYDLPETKGKTLVEIQRELKGETKQEHLT